MQELCLLRLPWYNRMCSCPSQWLLAHLIGKCHQPDITLVHPWNLPGARFCTKAKRSFLSLMRWVLSDGTRLSLTCLAFAPVSNALAVIRVGVIVHVGSCCLCLLGVTQVAVLVTTTWVTSKDHVASVIVARVLVKVVFTGFGVLVVVGRKTEGLVTVDGLSIVVVMSVLVEV